MNTVREWLQRLKGKPVTVSSREQYRWNEALELLGHVESDSSWVELSSHCNGFIREAAVRELCSHSSPEALVALIQRLNDWVPQVRDLAANGLQSYLSPSHAMSLLAALEPLIALAGQRRVDHSPTLKTARTLLQSSEMRDTVYANFLARQGKTARYLFELLIENQTASDMLLSSALAHRELTVRLMAVSACQALPTARAMPLLLEALSRPGAKVRVRVLHALLPMLDDPTPVLRNALLDASPAIRNLARWAAPRHNINALVVLTAQLNQEPPTGKRDWLGCLGLAAELGAELPERWRIEALHSPYATVRQLAVRLLRDEQLHELFEALDDPSDNVFFAVVAQLGKQPWAFIAVEIGRKLDRDWHELSTARRQGIFQLQPAWQQLAYLVRRLDTGAAERVFWLDQIDLWCDRQYQIVDPVTTGSARAVLVEELRHLAENGLIRSDSFARVAG
ncbi:HEAT repeat domain-containing protein [Pseudomonas sp. NPDC087346]|uniref:HEAT repeat domain-containing protein n=1 Tax=Pseudomonas sp. NPDC087346 TaxID=3364438 RepID=UPI0038122128